MCHKLTLCQDIAAKLHDVLTDDWFFSYTDEIVVGAVHALSPGQLKSTTTVAHAIMKAHAFTQWDKPNTNGYRQLFTDICDAIDWILNDYAKFLGRQMELEPVLTARSKARPRKVLPLTRQQTKAFENYIATIARNKALAGRQFPPNVVDLVQYRAINCKEVRQ
jgi:hypothetical protein